MTIHIGIVIPLHEEFDVLDHILTELGIELKPCEKDTTNVQYYEFSYHSIKPYNCIVAVIGDMGQDSAALLTERLITRWQPRIMCLAGIAGGLSSDVKLGDVVVAEQINHYLKKTIAVSSQKGKGQGKDYEFIPSADYYRPDDEYVQFFKNYRTAQRDSFSKWQSTSRSDAEREFVSIDVSKLLAKEYLAVSPKIHVGDIASGDIVGSAEPFRQWLLTLNRKFIAIEMEAAGFMRAIEMRRDGPKSLMLRGISDLGNSMKSKLDRVGKGAIRRWAMTNAVRLLFRLIETDSFDGSTKRSSHEGVCPSAPPHSKRFAGRRSQIAELKSSVSANPDQNLSIHGLPGIGKTELAIEFAQVAIQQLGFTAIFSAKVGRYPDTNAILRKWLVFVDPKLPSEIDDPQQNTDYVRAQLEKMVRDNCDGQVMAFFDDVWEESVDTVRLLLEALPIKRTILITTQSKAVSQQLSCRLHTLNPLLPHEAKELLLGQISNSLVTERELDTLIPLLDGHPLALELTAGTLNSSEEPAIIIREYRSRLLEGLPEGMTTGKSKKDSLQVTFEIAYDNLTERQQRCFRAIGIFGENTSFDPRMVSALLNTDEAEVRQLLRELRLQAIVQPSDPAKGTYLWYQQHILLRAFARDRLRKANEFSETFRRYVEFVEVIATTYGKQTIEDWQRFSAYLPHFRYMGEKLNLELSDQIEMYSQLSEPTAIVVSNFPINSHSEKAELALRFAVSVDPIIYNHDELQEVGKKWLSLGLAAARLTGDRASTAKLMNSMGNWYAKRPDYDIALQYYLCAARVARTIDAPNTKAEIVHNIGRTHADRGELRRALYFYDQAAVLWDQIGDEPQKAITLNSKGSISLDMGQPDKAKTFYSEALQLQMKHPEDKLSQANTRNNLGDLYLNQGQYAQARENFFQALCLYRQTGNKMAQGNVLVNIGVVHLRDTSDDAKNLRRAFREFRLGEQILKEVEDGIGEAYAIYYIGEAYRKSNDPGAAIEYYDRAITKLANINPTGRARAMHGKSRAQYDTGERDRAIKYMQESVEFVLLLEEFYSTKAHVLLGLSLVHLQEGLRVLGEVYDQMSTGNLVTVAYRVKRDAIEANVRRLREIVSNLNH